VNRLKNLFISFKASPWFGRAGIVAIAVLVAGGAWAAGRYGGPQTAANTKTPAATVEASSSPSETPSPSPTPTPATPTPVAAKPSAAAPAGAARVQTNCAKPVFTTSSHNGMWSNGGYFVHNNMWNDSETLGPETLYACSYHSWYVTSTQTNHAGAVKTYPNVHKDYNDKAVSSFNSITSTFGATSPHVGIYNVAYDIWLNGIADNNSTELMIWTENYKQTPAGSRVATATFGGHTYNVWKESDNKYIAFVPTTPMTSGNLNLLEMFKWLQSKGWLNSGATVGQIDYGVEIVSTDGKPATFSFTDFSITSN
jgi:hypothetical protein